MTRFKSNIKPIFMGIHLRALFVIFVFVIYSYLIINSDLRSSHVINMSLCKLIHYFINIMYRIVFALTYYGCFFFLCLLVIKKQFRITVSPSRYLPNQISGGQYFVKFGKHGLTRFVYFFSFLLHDSRLPKVKIHK